MKKLCLIVAAAIFSLTSVYAQGDVKIGAKAGVNFASLTGDDEGLEGKTSFHVGAVVEIPVSDVFSVQPELLFSDQGAKFEENNDVKFNVGYLSVPIMAKYYVAEGFSLEAGPQVGFLLSAKLKDDNDSEDIKDELKGIDFGLGLGAGYRLDNGLNFNLRYNLGLSNIVDDDSSESDDFELKNSVFQISVGYFFN